MKRRDFLRFVGGAAMAWPLPTYAQQKMPRVGILVASEPGTMGPFRQALRDIGYIEGQTIQLDMQVANGRIDRLPPLPRNWFAARLTSSSLRKRRPSSRRKTPRAISRSSWARPAIQSAQD